MRKSERSNKAKPPTFYGNYVSYADTLDSDSSLESEVESPGLHQQESPGLRTTFQDAENAEDLMALEEIKDIHTLLDTISADQKEASEQFSISQNNLIAQVELSRTEMNDGVTTLKQLIEELKAEVSNNTAAISILQAQINRSASTIDALRTPVRNRPNQQTSASELNNGLQEDRSGSGSSASASSASNNSSVEILTRQISQSITSALGAHRRLIKLPKFNGDVLKWPQFIAQFNRTTEREGYSTEDNVTRLEEALEGKAMDLVSSLLIHHRNVPRIIERLKSRFGNPEQLVSAQLEAIRKIEAIPDDELFMIVPFADQVLSLRSFLEGAGCMGHLNSPDLLTELEKKLPYRERIAWAGYSLSLRPPTVVGFCDWIEILADQIHRMKSKETDKRKKKARVLHLSSDNDSICIVCESDHGLAECVEFKKMQYKDRWTLIQNHNMCFGCLMTGHQVFQCKDNKRCGIDSCTNKHHELLHDPNSKEATKSTVPLVERLLNFESEAIKVLFKIVPVKLFGPTGKIETFAFLDEGSSITLVNKEIANKIGAHGPRSKIHLRWFGNKESEEEVTTTDLHVSGAYSNAKQYRLRRVHVVDDLKLPEQTLNLDSLSEKFRSMKKLPIQKYEKAVPTILIGLDNAYLGVARNKQWNNDEGPIVCLTKLGYVVYGPTGIRSDSSITTNLLIVEKTEEDLHALVKNYFSTEDFGIKALPVMESEDDKKAKHILERTTVQVGDRYESGLLWRQEDTELPDNFSMAMKRLESCERKMTKDPSYAAAYHKTMAGYFSKGYAKKLTPFEVSNANGPVWYLPHFGVMNPNKPKLRLVFDAAASFRGISLNSKLLSGPDLNQPLVKILSLFRENEYGVCADIKEMYHQVLIRKNDKDAQRFLYRENPTDPVQICRMEVMTFGSTCSPVTAQYVKNRNANSFLEHSPSAVKAILENHYVDDFVSSFSTEEEALKVSEEVKMIHMKAGFELRGFVSNSPHVADALNQCEREECSLNLNMDKDVNEKILGLQWNTDSDVFLFKLNFNRIDRKIIDQQRSPTKREFLAIIMSIFDPFGFVADFVIHMKILLQKIWKARVGWDEVIPKEYQKEWNQWMTELHKVKELKIPRCLAVNLFQAESIEWHTMVDASESAFSAVCYILVKYKDGTKDVVFIAGKTKCSPLKYLSIPRLELQAAVLGVRLTATFSAIHSFKVDQYYYWSDSKTVLFWIKDEQRRYRQFVSNRLSEILDSSESSDWYWVPSCDNVADDATRSKKLPCYQPNNRWVLGPKWLKEGNWPKQPNEFTASSADIDSVDSEVINEHKGVVLLVTHPVINIGNYSSLTKLKRHMAWLLRFVRFIENRKKLNYTGDLLASELKYAELVLCRIVQRQVFNKEYEALSSKKKVNKGSSIYRLVPYLDDDNILRVYGRVDNAPTIPLFTKRPIILPKSHSLTNIIVQSYHDACGHQFDEMTVAEIRRMFWIDGIKTVVKKVKRDCIQCKLFNAKPAQPLMGQIPKERLTPYVRPFSFTGVDYFGPVYVTIGRRREKRWVALFTCLTVRAVHLEISQDLSSDSFILCLKNLMNLRGVPTVMFSDNGSNIVGAKNEIIRSSDFFEHCGIKRLVADKGISWKFNNPGDPAAGGCWERLVQSIKRVLKRIMVDVAPKVETLRSFLIEASNIVNSRPLTDLVLDSISDDPLTPNSFLIGCPNWIQTPGPLDEKLWCLRKQWRILNALKNHFWSKWINDYLPTLTRRSKWLERVEPVKVGDVVLVCDSDLSRRDWPRGIIRSVIPGKDGQVRSVVVFVGGKELRRPASKIAVLDIGNTSTEDELRGAGCHLGQALSAKE